MPHPSTAITLSVALSGALSGALAAQTPIVLNGNVYDGAGGPLLANRVYHIVGSGGSCGITVPTGQTLTIQPGAIVKVGGCWSVNGRVLAPGTTAQGIVITSIHDDTAGGDTNQNGSATVPQSGDWANIDWFGDGTAWEHVQFRYGGSTSYPAFNLRSRQVAFRHCLIEKAAGVAAAQAGGGVFEDTEFRDCAGIPVTGMSLATLALCLDNRTVRCGADYFRVEYAMPFTADVGLIRRNTINASGVVVLDLSGPQSPAIPVGRTLTLAAGLQLKFVRGSILCNGRILAQGAPPPYEVVFTSFHDDVFGGDTNRDGNATQGAPGDWGGITLAAGDTSRMDWTAIRFAGQGGRALRIDGSSAVLQTCAVIGSAGTGISFGAVATPRASLRDTWALDCVGAGIRDIAWSTLAACRHLWCGNNGGGNHIGVAGEAIAQPVVIDKNCFLGADPVLESYGGLTINAGGSLELPAGTIVKRTVTNQILVQNGGELRLRGTARRPVVITSFRDDSIGGDTNRDGAGTMPAPGDWGNVTVSGPGRVHLENVLLRYGAGGTLTTSGTGSNHLARVRVDRAAGDGFAVGAVATADDLVAWGCVGDGIRCTSGAFAIRHATAAGNGGFGIRRASTAWTGQALNCNAFGNAGGNYGLLASQVVSSNGGFAGTAGNLAVDPLFVDEPAGDLRLQAGSPCLGAADLATALAVGRDFDEFPRVLDAALGGAAAPDMGAHERAPFTLDVVGEPRPAWPLQLTVQGPPGMALFALGLLDGPPVWLPPFGSLLIGNTFALLGTAATGSTLTYVVPGGAAILGLDVAVQAFAIAGPASFTNVDRWRLWN